MKLFLSIICVNVFFAAIKVDYVEAYYDEGLNNQNHDLFRPRINKDNTVISAEIYTKTKYQDERDDSQILFFKRESDQNPKKAYTFKTKMDEITEQSQVCRTGYVLWSKENADVFYSIKKDINENDGSSIQRWCMSKIDISTMVPKFNKRYSPLWDLKGHKKLKINYDARYISYHTLISDKGDKDKSFMLFLDGEDKIMKLKSNHSNYKSNNQYVLPDIQTSIFDASSKFDVAEQYTTSGQKNGSYNIVAQYFNDITQQSIYFICNTSKNQNFIHIYPSEESKQSSQIDPLFNSRPNPEGPQYISFLSFQPNSNRHFDLYVADISECDNCGSFRLKYENAPLDLHYKKIDSFVVAEPTLDDNLNYYNSYCWHPTKNILFYIKKESGTRTKSIYYYDLDNDSGPKKLNISTDNNKYLSISDDGEYLLFSFLGVFEEDRASFKFNNSDDPELGSYAGNHKIGVAKLIYD